MGKVLVLVTMLAACSVDDEPMCEADAACAADVCKQACLTRATFDVTWTMAGTSDSRGVPDPVQCTETISHPCPFLLYTRTLMLDHTRATWTNATGGIDEAGVPAENRLPWVDELTFESGALVIPQRGDDGGLRREAVLAKTRDGYAGDVAWTLFTVAGTTTFHVELARIE